jgi:protein tyrosine phosphatase (PTP) superfamily phosphohydrolase (DUF442 family)
MLPLLISPNPPYRLPRPARFYQTLLFRGAVLAALAVLLSVGAFAGWRVITHNEDTVEPGKLYRSGQLTGPELREEIRRDNIQSVVNLRGANLRADWYKEELAVCQELGVRHFDVKLSAVHLPPPVELDKLLAALQEAPRPILIHCRSGSDRTGLAACVFLIDQEHMPWRQAENALTVSYGHFALYPYFEMNELVQLYGQSGDPSLRDWAAHRYPAVYAEEMHESTWDEMMEPVELLVRGRLD